MKWYAIRTRPGAQQPQREYAVETTALGKDGKPMGKGYRIVPSLQPRVSAVEKALTEAGFSHYMPAEFKVVRDRKKTGVYKLRRFPLLQGYVFIHGEPDWNVLRETPGVAAVVGAGDRALIVRLADIMALRTIEAKSEEKADREVAKMNNAVNSEAVKTAAKALSAAKRKISAGSRIKVQWGKAVGHEATVLGWDEQGRVKAIIDGLDGFGEMRLPHETVKLVA